MRKHFSPGIVLTAVVFIALLAACGGGDGGGTTLTNYYDGPTGAASIGNIADAEEIVVEVYENGDPSDITDMADPSMIIASRALSLATETLRAAAFDSGSGEEPSDSSCTDSTGKVTGKYSIEFDGSFTITMTFNNFCMWYGAGEDYMNGSVSMSGYFFDVTATPLEIKNVTVTIPSMNIKEYALTPSALLGDFSTSAKLTVSAPDEMTETMTMNMTAKDNISGESFKVANYKISITDNGVDAEEITVTSGTFYHSGHGSVSIATKAGMPLVEGYWDDYPSTGVIVITGDGWTAELDFDDDPPTRLNEATLTVTGTLVNGTAEITL